MLADCVGMAARGPGPLCFSLLLLKVLLLDVRLLLGSVGNAGMVSCPGDGWGREARLSLSALRPGSFELALSSETSAKLHAKANIYRDSHQATSRVWQQLACQVWLRLQACNAAWCCSAGTTHDGCKLVSSCL